MNGGVQVNGGTDLYSATPPMTKERDAEQDDRKSDAWGAQVSDGHDRWGWQQENSRPLQDGCLSLSIPQAVRDLVRSAGRARPGESAKGPEVRIPVVDPERRIQVIEPADEDQFLDVIVVSKQRQGAIGSAQRIAVL